MAEMNPKRKIVIDGGGFAGIQLARKLDKDLFDVLLIDKMETATLDAAICSVILADSLTHLKTFAVMYALSAICYKNATFYLKLR